MNTRAICIVLAGLFLSGCAATLQSAHVGDDSYSVKGIAFGRANINAIQSSMSLSQVDGESLLEINQDVQDIISDMTPAEVADLIMRLSAIAAL